MENYVIIDLEMCNVPSARRTEDFKCKNEVIQIGAALLDSSYEICDTFAAFVQPEYGALDEFISELTGINESDLEGARRFEDVLKDFTRWLPDNSTLVSWSKNDKTQLRREMTQKGIDFPKLNGIMQNWEDCQKTFDKIMGASRNYGLVDALNVSSVDYDQNAHNALVDAKNTALLFAKMKREEKTGFILSPYISIGGESAGFTPFADLLKDLCPVSA